jgi:hypothetical protein
LENDGIFISQFEKLPMMSDRLTVRVLWIIVALVLLFGLSVWFGSLGPDQRVGSFPDEDELGTNYNWYVGQEVIVSGNVVRVDPVTVRATYGPGRQFDTTLRGIDKTVAYGDKVRVFGVARSGYVVDVRRVLVVPSEGHLYTWSISLVAVLWVLGRLVRDWQIDRLSLSLEPRSQTLSLRVWDWRDD